MIRLGVRGHDLPGKTLEEFVATMEKYPKLSHIQFAPMKSFPNIFTSSDKLSPGLALYVQETLKKYNLSISILGCYLNIMQFEEKPELKKTFFDYMLYTRAFGSEVIATETGSVGKGYTPDNFTEEAFQKALRIIEEMAAQAEKTGIILGIEPGINHPLCSIKKARRMLEAIPINNLRILLDIANLITPENVDHQEALIEEAFETLGPWICHCHLKDFVLENGKIKAVPFGTGQLQIPKYLSAIQAYKPYCNCTFEATKEDGIEHAIHITEQFIVN